MTKQLPPSIAKRRTIQSLLAVSAIGLGVAGVMTQIDRGNPAEAAQAEDPAQPSELAELTYSRVHELRRQNGLENKDLAALGLTQSETSAVLTRLVQWCETNEAAITSARQAVITAKRNLREQQRLVRVGQASERQKSDADGKAQALADAEHAYASLLNNGAVNAIEAPGIDLAKASRWQAGSLLSDRLDHELRLIPGMDTGRAGMLESESARLGTAVEDVLLPSEQRALQSLRETRRSSMAGVLVAEAVVLPVPEGLRGEELLDAAPAGE
ncbi:MAG: hypothetical protein AAGC72_05170 [Planctomycetota bacterium]